MSLSKLKKMKNTRSSQPIFDSSNLNDEDDFQNPTQSLPLTQTRPSSLHPLKPSNSAGIRPPKKQKKNHTLPGKENQVCGPDSQLDLGLDLDLDCSLESIESTVFCSKNNKADDGVSVMGDENDVKQKEGFSYLANSIESRLLRSRGNNCGLSVCENGKANVDDGAKETVGEFEEAGTTQLDVLLKLCSSEGDEMDMGSNVDCGSSINCPMCGVDISNMCDELRQVHTNECLDKLEAPIDVAFPDNDPVLECPGQVLDDPPSGAPGQLRDNPPSGAPGQLRDNPPSGAPGHAIDVSPVLEWLRHLGLSRYQDVFIQEEIDWDSLQWLTDEDLCNIGITALGPRKKIVHALSELRNEGSKTVDVPEKIIDVETPKVATNKLITDFFPGFAAKVKNGCTTGAQVGKTNSTAANKRNVVKRNVSNKKLRDIPLWCCITGTPFRVDAFKYLRRDCFHWFLTHFHTDHYQGLTKSFCHGKIYCSLITAKLVNLKIGIAWDKIEVLPLNQKINISGIDVTCFDANHCPGSIIILFEPPSGKAILHTGDFRFCEDMTKISFFQTRVHTLILDTTYCDPKYDFPKQEAVIQYVIEAIQAEAFNPRTLFLIGSYTIGKERLFMEVARVLHKKVYVTAAKMRLLECLGFPKEDMQWLTTNEQDSHIHVVPMWTLASFKRLKHISNQYMGRFNLIVAFSPTGWTFGRGKKSSPGRRWQQGTVIRYEVPYSEHSSFTELKEFVKFISPVNIIPSVNNNGPESASKMVSLLSP